MDERNFSSLIESFRKQTEAAKIDALQKHQHWLEVALRADGGLLMLGEIEKALRERSQDESTESSQQLGERSFRAVG